MHTQTFFSDEDDTIMSGVISLATSGSWPIALLVFFASIVVPLLKLVAIGETPPRGSAQIRCATRRQRSRLFRIVEFIGRWSMLDVFAISLLVTLVQVQSFAVDPGPPRRARLCGGGGADHARRPIVRRAVALGHPTSDG